MARRNKAEFRYDRRTGRIVPIEGQAERGPALHTRFRPFTSAQFGAADCAAVGVPRDEEGAAQFTSERQLNEMQAHMARTGRYLTWKAH